MSVPLKIGVQLPEVEREVRWPELRDMARVAEEVGLDSIWLGDHLLFRDPVTGTRGPWEAWSLLAALGEATERVAIGPLVAATSFHNPAMIAKKAATVDEISGGRLVLGLGAGWNEAEYQAFGFPYDHRVARFEEAFTIIKTLIREGSIDHEGRFFTHREMELLPRARSGMQLLVGSNGPRMLRITTPHIDIWNSWYTWFDNEPEGLAPLVEELEWAAAEVGRDASTIERSAAVLVQMEGGTGRIAGSTDRPATTPITGSREVLAEALSRFGEAGMGLLQVVLDPIDAASIEELGEVARLIPASAASG
jgi:alkanesulfonate monooxygenase SsuD/methylene tetrahydromethanopterin reductase-like flavin-dependent oxidoreductase (luciferase family)